MAKRRSYDKFTVTPRKMQLTLDFGQKDIGPKLCKECLMVYTVGDTADLKSHAQYHAKYLNHIIKVSRWQNQKVLEEHFDGSRIIEIPQDDRIGMALFQRLSELMARDLGYDRPTYDTSKNLNRFCDNSGVEVPPYVRIFVFVEGEKRTAVGCCLAEELTVTSVKQHGYDLQRLSGGLRSLLSWRIQTGLLDEENGQTTSAPVIKACPKKSSFQLPLCGIRRLWVSPKHRRQKTATILVDCVLKNLYYLTHLTRDQVAFSEPTADGAGFAKNYTGREDFVIY